MVGVGVPVRRPPAPVRRYAYPRRLHQRSSAQALVVEASDAIHCGGCRRSPVPLVWPFAAPKASGSFTGFDAATTAAADSSLRLDRRRPFRREARSPQVRTSAFLARPSDLRHQPLATRASRSFGRSPWRVPPRIGFLFVGPRVRSPLPQDPRSRSGPCGSLRFLRPGPERTCTSESMPMLGAQKHREVWRQTSQHYGKMPRSL
jgi:hypothetical protein